MRQMLENKKENLSTENLKPLLKFKFKTSKL